MPVKCLGPLTKGCKHYYIVAGMWLPTASGNEELSAVAGVGCLSSSKCPRKFAAQLPHSGPVGLRVLELRSHYLSRYRSSRQTLRDG